jgi:hypothetical protein
LQRDVDLVAKVSEIVAHVSTAFLVVPMLDCSYLVTA